MNSEQKALIVQAGPDTQRGLDELNVQLNRGWRVTHVAPMGAAGVGARDDSPALHFAALVVIERESDRLAASTMTAEEEVEEFLEELADPDSGAETGQEIRLPNGD